MRSAVDVRRHLHSVNKAASVQAAPAIQRPLALQPDWQRIFTDLTRLGVIRLRVANPVAGLECLAEPWSASIEGGLIRVDGPGIDLLALPANLASATVENGAGDEPDGHRLRWFGWRNDEVMRVALTQDSTWSCFRSILVRQWAQPATPRTVATDPEASAVFELARWVEAITCRGRPDPLQAWYLPRAAIAGRPDGRAVRLVDPSLISPFLETVADQGCGMRASVGNTVALQTHDTDFYAFRCEDRVLRLSGSTACLTLAHEQLGSAEVVAGIDGDNRCLRLRDTEGRAVAMLGASTAANADLELWETLINALLD